MIGRCHLTALLAMKKFHSQKQFTFLSLLSSILLNKKAILLYSYKFKILVYSHERCAFPHTFAIFSDTILPLIGYKYVRLKYLNDQVRDKYEPYMKQLPIYSTT